MIINFSKKRAAAEVSGTTPPPVGRGVAMAIGTFLLVIAASICQHQVCCSFTVKNQSFALILFLISFSGDL
jgi:hypothetical protein